MIQDSVRDIMVVAIHAIWGHMNVEIAEAMVIKWGLKIAFDAGLQTLIVKFDPISALNVIKMVNGSLFSLGGS